MIIIKVDENKVLYSGKWISYIKIKYVSITVIININMDKNHFPNDMIIADFYTNPLQGIF